MNHTTAVTHKMDVGKCLFILLMATHLVVIYADEYVYNYDDEYYDYDEPDLCKKYHDCNIDDIKHLPTMEQLYGKHVTKCCSNTHGYTFKDNCKVCILLNYSILPLTVYCIECYAIKGHRFNF